MQFWFSAETVYQFQPCWDAVFTRHFGHEIGCLNFTNACCRNGQRFLANPPKYLTAGGDVFEVYLSNSNRDRFGLKYIIKMLAKTRFSASPCASFK
jgi:hypothetical protein